MNKKRFFLTIVILLLGILLCSCANVPPETNDPALTSPRITQPVADNTQPKQTEPIQNENSEQVNESQQTEKSYLSIEQSTAIIDKETLLQTGELIIQGYVTEKKSEIMTNPDQTRMDSGKNIIPNEQITEYAVQVTKVYKGDYKQDTITVKTSNGYGLSPDLILSGEDETTILAHPLERLDLQIGKECILILTYVQEGTPEKIGYYPRYGKQGYFVLSGDGKFTNDSPKENVTLQPATLTNELSTLEIK